MDFHDPFSSASHLAFAGFLLFAGGLLARLSRRHEQFQRWSVCGFAVSAVLLYTASGLFHGVRYPSDWHRELFRRFDLSGIFLLVAGSLLPVFAYLLTGWWRVGMTGVLCLMALGGVTTIWAIDAPNSGTMVPVYALMAVVGMIPFPNYIRAGGRPAVLWMLAAAGVYALGGVCEVLKWPTLIPGVVGPHELLHVTDMAGTLTTLALVFRLVRTRGQFAPVPDCSNR